VPQRSLPWRAPHVSTIAVGNNRAPNSPGICREAVGQAQGLVREIDRLLHRRLVGRLSTTTASSMVTAATTSASSAAVRANGRKKPEEVSPPATQAIGIPTLQIKAKWVCVTEGIIGNISVSVPGLQSYSVTNPVDSYRLGKSAPSGLEIERKKPPENKFSGRKAQ
jgi:hypothetical protein